MVTWTAAGEFEICGRVSTSSSERERAAHDGPGERKCHLHHFLLVLDDCTHVSILRTDEMLRRLASVDESETVTSLAGGDRAAEKEQLRGEGVAGDEGDPRDGTLSSDDAVLDLREAKRLPDASSRSEQR